jgi:hypothetical protein
MLNIQPRTPPAGRYTAGCRSCATPSRLLSRLMGVVLVSFLLLVSHRASAGSQNPVEADPVSVSTAWSVDRARPGDTLVLAILVNINKGFHINADENQIQPFEDFKPYPTRVKVIDIPETLTLAAPIYPKAVPVKVQYAAGNLMSFEGQTIIYLQTQLEEVIRPGILDLKLDFEYQACAENYCLFPKIVRLEASLPVAQPDAEVSKINAELFSAYFGIPAAAAPRRVYFAMFDWSFSIDVTSALGLGLLLITAAFGGVLLNFTPCVLPVIPIKMISLSRAAHHRKQCLMLGTAMFLGVLFFWMVLGAVIALVSGFTATNQLFQYRQ